MYSGKGTGVYQGIAIGKIKVIQSGNISVTEEKIEDIDAEIKKYENIREKAKAELTELYNKAVKELGEEDAMIIDIQRMLVEDLDFMDFVEAKIKEEKSNVSLALKNAGEYFSEVFANMDDAYMRERAADIKDLSRRLVRISVDSAADNMDLTEDCIVVAEDLTPSETIHLDKKKLLGFVITKGSPTCHTAILAKNLGIPALVGADVENLSELEGHNIIVDGIEGKYYLDPDDETLKKKQAEKAVLDEEKKTLETLRGVETKTLSGRKVNLFANIGGPSDIEGVLENDAEGIGLFRSEFLYLDRSTAPSEDEQFTAYKNVVEKMNGKLVVIRTCDIGSDKQVSYLESGNEDNPAMGCRGIRLMLNNPELFKVQLRAILRSAAYGNVAIMLPMVSNLKEVTETKKLIDEAAKELEDRNEKFTVPDLGIMIETPAAALISDQLAPQVKFFSVGTNDLTQYTLAADRMNSTLKRCYDPHHEAVMRLLEIIVDNAHKAGIWAGICGELASDYSVIERLVDMGYDELSVAPTCVLKARSIINKCK